MPLNLTGSLQDKRLERHLQLFSDEIGEFLADKVFPRLTVPSPTGNFLELQGGFAAAAPGHSYYRDAEADYRTLPVSVTSGNSWRIRDFGAGVNVDLKEALYAAAGQVLANARRSKGRVLRHHMMIERERIAAALAFSATVFSGYSTTLSGNDQLNVATSDLIGVIDDAAEAIDLAGGGPYTDVLMGVQAARVLRKHPQVVEHWSRTRNSVGRVTDQVLAEVFEVEPTNFHVGRVRANAAVAGQTESIGYVWGKKILFFRKSASPTPETPQGTMNRFVLDGGDDATVRRWNKTPFVERQVHSWDEEFNCHTPKNGHLIIDAVA